MNLSQKQLQIEQRVKDEAQWYIDHRSSVRDVAEHFKISKSTVYTDFTQRLKYIDQDLYEKVLMLLHYNKVHCIDKMTKASRMKRLKGDKIYDRNQ